jgi:hypothetical protein
MNPLADESGRTGALEMPGATSGDVHKVSTFARPMEGQTLRARRPQQKEAQRAEGRWRDALHVGRDG